MLNKVLFGLVGLLLLEGAALAVEIQVQKKPAPKVAANQYVVYDTWTVSYSRKHNREAFELDSFHKTEEAARNRAEKLKAWDKEIKDPAWKLAVILIEGEASVFSK